MMEDRLCLSDPVTYADIYLTWIMPETHEDGLEMIEKMKDDFSGDYYIILCDQVDGDMKPFNKMLNDLKQPAHIKVFKSKARFEAKQHEFKDLRKTKFEYMDNDGKLEYQIRNFWKREGNIPQEEFDAEVATFMDWVEENFGQRKEFEFFDEDGLKVKKGNYKDVMRVVHFNWEKRDYKTSWYEWSGCAGYTI